MATQYSGQSNHPELDFTESTASSQMLSNKAIFRRLIGEEIRNGRLSTHRRKRIVQYAAHLGLSAVEMGEMIEQCSQDCFGESHPQNLQPELQMMESSEQPSHTAIAMCLAGLICILAGMAYIASNL